MFLLNLYELCYYLQLLHERTWDFSQEEFHAAYKLRHKSYNPHIQLFEMSFGQRRTLFVRFLTIFGLVLCSNSQDSDFVNNITVHYYTLWDGDSQNSCSDSLETIANKTADLSGEAVQIDITTPHLSLNHSITFRHLYDLSITGECNSLTIIECMDGNAGITFENISKLTLYNLTLTHCGSAFMIRNFSYKSALILRFCCDVEFSNLFVTRSNGIGLTIVQHRMGNVHISASNFTENELQQSERTEVYGGGGVYVGDFMSKITYPVSFTFEGCIFSKNTACTIGYRSIYTDEFGVPRDGFGRGGGIFVRLRGIIKHKNVNFTFSSCEFTNNRAFLGGGISVDMTAKQYQNITVILRNSVFDSNNCSSDRNIGIGGGAHLSYWSSYSGGAKGDLKYYLQNVTFRKNCAELGGGMYFNSYVRNSDSTSFMLNFTNCTFKGNTAHTGSAVDIAPNVFKALSSHSKAAVSVFINCKFAQNRVFVNTNSDSIQKTVGIGTIYSSLYDIKFEGNNLFENNSGTPVYMVNGIADFTNSSATFKNNKGIRGGAIALIGASSMIVGPNRQYMFLNNLAYYQGGAIFTLQIDNLDFTQSKTCFIQYFDGARDMSLTRTWNNNITFVGNEASFGSAIFTTSLHACQTIRNTYHRLNIIKASDVFLIRGINVSTSDVSTEGAHLYRKYDSMSIIPGKLYNHGVTIKDDLMNEIREPLRVRVHFKSGVTLDPAFSSFVGDKMQLRGRPGERVNLTFQTVSTRESYTSLEVEIVECPPGFRLEIDRCICDTNNYYGLTDYCDSENFQTYLIPGIWVGQVNENEMATTTCPHSFCNYTQLLSDDNKDTTAAILGIMLPQNKSELDKAICGISRTGILCGKCRQNYVVHFHSPKFLCSQVNTSLCKAGWLFYILSELVPTTVLFIIVIVFNISFTSGAVNGFILFSQVLLSLNIDASGIITFPNQRALTEGYQIVYGILNLDFFTAESLSFCLWPNATALHMLAFKYVTIVYALSLVILVIWFMNKCGGRCLGRWCRITTVKSSIIHGVSAFFIICYSQSVSVSHSIVNGVELQFREGSNITFPKRVWLDGNIEHLSKNHLPYALPAIICLTTIGAVPPMILLVYPLSNKLLSFFGLEETKLVNCISRKLPISSLIPLLDCFQSCFKDDLRFFAGLYFLYRWIIPIIYSTATSLGVAYITTEILLIFVLAIHAFSQPYAVRVHNVVDTLLFTDLLLINSITCIHYHLFQSRESLHTVKKTVARSIIIQATLIYLPFFAMSVYTLHLGCKRIMHHCNRSNFKYGYNIDGFNIQKLRAGLLSKSTSDSRHDEKELTNRFIAADEDYYI